MGEIIDVYGDAIKVFFGVALAGGLMAAFMDRQLQMYLRHY